MAEYEATMAMAALGSPEAIVAAPPAPMDILDVAEPSAQMKAEMRMATKTPSEWLRLLCRDWSLENEAVVADTDMRFLHYKSYLKGQLTSQLLCRLSISGNEPTHNVTTFEMAHDPTSLPTPPKMSLDFWKILGVDDEFDRAHIIANIERFCSLYNIRGGTLDEFPVSPERIDNTTGMIGYNYPDVNIHHPIDPATAAAAAAAVGMSVPPGTLYYPTDPIEDKMMDQPPAKMLRQTSKSHERRLKAELREREREAYSARKAAEKAARLATREERRQRKLAMRRQREEFAREQKEAALRRAAELVQSNRVPIEITRGAAAAQAASNAAMANAVLPAAAAASLVPAATAIPVVPAGPIKKGRSSIVISTASDLDQIVTHSNNLWSKYNAIAKEHNKKVNWIVVAKELGIHVKVREKYARMHARAKARGFDFVNWGHYRIKDYPQFFLDPLGPAAAAMPEPAQIVEDPGAGKRACSADPPKVVEEPGAKPASSEGGALRARHYQRPVAEAVAFEMQPHLAHHVHQIPSRDMMSLAAEAAGVVDDGGSYSGDPAVVAAAAAVQQQHHRPPSQVSGDEAHIVPPLPQTSETPPMDEMKSVEQPEWGGMTPV